MDCGTFRSAAQIQCMSGVGKEMLACRISNMEPSTTVVCFLQ